MWPFGQPKIAPDDLRRVRELEERVSRFERQLAAVLEDIDEYFRKINKARQRVVKEDADVGRAAAVGRGAVGVAEVPPSRETLKAQLRAKLRGA